ncbi:MAG: AAA family ATPase [SAR202 cluster bacterium]|nr:AAA family ATPase [SAR202 cluster bacterium]
MGRKIELTADKLRRTFDLSAMEFDTTEQIEPIEGIVGQERALRALQTGLGIRNSGFNIYVSGPPGTGKMTTVTTFLKELASGQKTPQDWVYLNNFDDVSKPTACGLPAGQGRELKHDMKDLMDRISGAISRAFESDEFGKKRDEIVREVHRKKDEALEALNRHAAAAGFTLHQMPFGFLIVPEREGQPIGDLELVALPAQEQEELQRRRQGLQDELRTVQNQLREPERAANEKLRELDRQVVNLILDQYMAEVRAKYGEFGKVVIYLDAVGKDIVDDIDTFKSGRTNVQGGSSSRQMLLPEAPSRKYDVNVLVDNSQLKGTPVVLELNPTYNNLFGRIEREAHLGTLYTDFTMVQPGAIHRANGGYLVLQVEDVLKNAFSWDSLKRALTSHQIEMEDMADRLGFGGGRSLRPHPTPLDLKVVLLGRPLIYYLLHAYDPDFSQLFKIKADFDTQMDASPDNIQEFLGLLSNFCRQEGLKPLDKGAAARTVEHASRLAEDQEKLSTHFGSLADVLKEADFLASQDNAEKVTLSHIEKALEEKVHRSNLIQMRIQEMIAQGTILVDTQGQACGQVNGISVISLGDHYFGRPSRITATVGPGGQGIVDIEREVELGGPVHSKGVYIIGGYLAHKYARDMVLSIAARIVFEQSYSGVEGDSASSAELFAILSELAGLPINQGIAVTGSVNQHGEAQPIGAVNEKIEGFFDMCKVLGLTRNQGVIIPKGNVRHLMLRKDVVEAVSAAKFHIWAIANVDEGMEILTGTPAGVARLDGTFPEHTVNHLVQNRLWEFTEQMKNIPEVAATLPRFAPRPKEVPEGIPEDDKYVEANFTE